MTIVDATRNMEIINWKTISDFLTPPPDEKANPDFKILISFTFDTKSAGYRPAAKLMMMYSSRSDKRTNGLKVRYYKIVFP
jgi:hypothetical protein